MSLILVVDDQYGKDTVMQNGFCRGAGLQMRRVAGDDIDNQSVGEVVFCRGQSVEYKNGREMRVTNDCKCVQDAVEQCGDELSLVLLDMHFCSGPIDDSGWPKGQDGDETFGNKIYTFLAGEFPELPIVILSSMKEGGLAQGHNLQYDNYFYFSKKDLCRERTVALLMKHGKIDATQAWNLLAKVAYGQEQMPEGYVLESPAIRTTYARALQIVAANNSLDPQEIPEPIVILGETGVGKRDIARFIHYSSSRRNKGKYVRVDCGTIDKNIIGAKSHLFGALKNSGYKVDAGAGCFRTADKGTIFLDEIEKLPYEIQRGVLTCIEEGRVYPLGPPGATVEPIRVNVQVVAAAHRPLGNRTDFLNDLGQRFLSEVDVPPLRERRKDIKGLIRYLLSIYFPGSELTKDFHGFLEEKHMYQNGNIRELRRVLRRSAQKHTGVNDLLLTGNEVMEEYRNNTSEEPAGSRIEQSPPQSTAGPASAPASCQDNSLATLVERIYSTNIGSDREVLQGILPKLEKTYKELRAAIAGAALSCCKDDVAEKFIGKRSADLLYGNRDGDSHRPSRTWKKALGRTDTKRVVTSKELEQLVNSWRQWPANQRQARSRS